MDNEKKGDSKPEEGEDLFSFFERLKTIGNLKRFGTLPMIQFESVAAHSFNVSVIAMMIADYQKDENINTEILLRKALLHDFEESILSDIPHSIKHRYKNGRLATLLEEIVPDLIKEEIFKELPVELQTHYVKYAQDAKKDKEGEMVEAADSMDTMLTSLRELKLGNKYFSKVFEASVELVQKYDHLNFVKLFLEKALEYRTQLNITSGESI